MMVSSDGYDLSFIAKMMGPFAWSENLIGGVGFYGTIWKGAGAALDFMKRAAEIGGVVNADICAYGIVGEERTRSVKLSHLEKVSRVDSRVRSIILRGIESRRGAENGNIMCGGEVGVYRKGVTKFDPVSGHFLFPWRSGGDVVACNILKIAAEILDASYGYFFLRDEFAFPGGFASGFCPAFGGFGRDNDDDCWDIMAWSDLIKNWVFKGEELRLRDIFNINLLCDKILEHNMSDGTSLGEWIRRDPGRGELSQIGSARYLWNLSDEEIEVVRPPLQHMGLCVASGRHYYRHI